MSIIKVRFFIFFLWVCNALCAVYKQLLSLAENTKSQWEKRSIRLKITQTLVSTLVQTHRNKKNKTCWIFYDMRSEFEFAKVDAA